MGAISREKYDPGVIIMCCIPIRLAQFVHGVLTQIICLLMLFYRYEWKFFWLGGGYSYETRIIMGCADLVGIFGGGFGTHSAWKNSAWSCAWFNLYQFLRWVALAICMFFDLRPIMRCEDYVKNISSAIQDMGFSRTLFDIAFEGQCAPERTLYFIFTYSLFVFYFYLLTRSVQFRWILEKTPRYSFQTNAAEVLSTYYLAKQHQQNGGGFAGGASKPEEYFHFLPPVMTTMPPAVTNTSSNGGAAPPFAPAPAVSSQFYGSTSLQRTSLVRGANGADQANISMDTSTVVPGGNTRAKRQSVTRASYVLVGGEQVKIEDDQIVKK